MGASNRKEEDLKRQKDIEERKARQEAERKRFEDEEKDRRVKFIESKHQFVTSLQSSGRGFLARQDAAKLRKLKETRQRIVNEILSTEKSYNSNLKICIELFYRPLMACALLEEEKHTRDFKKRQKQTVKNKSDIENYYQTPTQQSPRDTINTSNSSLDLSKYLERKPTLQNMTSSDIPNISNIPILSGLTKQDVKTVFSLIEAIYLYSQKFVEQLDKSLKAPILSEEIGLRFLEMVDFLKGYVQYVNNYNAALQCLEKLNQDPKFNEWLEETYKRPECNNNTIQSFLIMPVQRVPRYQLLLADLIRNVPEGMPRVNIDKAHSKIIEVANTINEKKRETEDFGIIISIYNKLDPKVDDLCAPHRRFIKEGFLKEDGDSEYCKFILFNDIILKVRSIKNGSTLRLLAHITLKTAHCNSLPDEPGKKIKNKFHLETPKKNIYLKTKTLEEKTEWLSLINDCINLQVTKSESFATLSKKNVN